MREIGAVETKNWFGYLLYLVEQGREAISLFAAKGALLDANAPGARSVAFRVWELQDLPFALCCQIGQCTVKILDTVWLAQNSEHLRSLLSGFTVACGENDRQRGARFLNRTREIEAVHRSRHHDIAQHQIEFCCIENLQRRTGVAGGFD